MKKKTKEEGVKRAKVTRRQFRIRDFEQFEETLSELKRLLFYMTTAIELVGEWIWACNRKKFWDTYNKGGWGAFPPNFLMLLPILDRFSRRATDYDGRERRYNRHGEPIDLSYDELLEFRNDFDTYLDAFWYLCDVMERSRFYDEYALKLLGTYIEELAAALSRFDMPKASATWGPRKKEGKSEDSNDCA